MSVYITETKKNLCQLYVLEITSTCALVTRLYTLFSVLLAYLLAEPGLSCSMWDPIPWLGTEARPPALGVWRLSHWTTKEVLTHCFQQETKDLSFNTAQFFNLFLQQLCFWKLVKKAWNHKAPSKGLSFAFHKFLIYLEFFFFNMVWSKKLSPLLTNLLDFFWCHSDSVSSNTKPGEEWTCSYHFPGRTAHLNNDRQPETSNPPYLNLLSPPMHYVIGF